MEEIKFYFKNEDSTFCYPLEEHIQEAKDEGFYEIEVLEAVPSKEMDKLWCSHYAEVVERHHCSKTECSYWERYKSSKVCKHRGCLFVKGKKVKVTIDKIKTNGYLLQSTEG